MKDTAVKYQIGYYAAIAASVLCLAAGAWYDYVKEVFPVYDPVLFWLLICGAAASSASLGSRAYQTAAIIIAAAAGGALAIFFYRYIGCFSAEQGVDTKLAVCLGLIAAGCIAGLVSVFTKKAIPVDVPTEEENS